MCPHLMPSGEGLAAALVRHGVADREAIAAMPCSDVHLLARSLGRSLVLATAEKRLVAEVFPYVPKPDTRRLLVILLYIATALLTLAGCGVIFDAAFL